MSARTRPRRLGRIGPLVLVALALPLGGAIQCTYVGLQTPTQSYGSFIDRLAAFLHSDVGSGTILEEGGHPIPPYFYSFAICDDVVEPFCAAPDRLFVVSYPAFTAAVGIRAFLAHYAYSGDAESKARAIELADWMLSHLTPGTDVYGRFPYSTTANGIFGELDPQTFPDGASIELDKAAMFADSLLHLWEATGTAAYLDGATQIGNVLVLRQRPDGSLPFKVIPASGEVFVDYTSDQIAFHRLFKHLHAITGTPALLAAANQSWAWILAYPVTTQDWRRFYEDVPNDSPSQVHYDALEVIRELVARATEDPQNLSRARTVFDWIEQRFLIISSPYYPLIPSIAEQTGFVLEGVLAATCSATIQWAGAASDLATATGDTALYKHAVEAVNVVTSAQQADGRTFTVIQDANGDRLYPISWYEQELIPLWMMLELMGRMPFLAPTDENHLLATSGVVQNIGYAPTQIGYQTRTAGVDLLRLAAAPSAVSSDGDVVPAVSDLTTVTQGYTWDAANQLLTVKHTGTVQLLSLP